LSSRREQTPDFRNEVEKILRLQDADINTRALGQTFEGTAFMDTGSGTIDFVNVSTNVVVGTQTGT
jgi:hypothetical protein